MQSTVVADEYLPHDISNFFSNNRLPRRGDAKRPWKCPIWWHSENDTWETRVGAAKLKRRVIRGVYPARKLSDSSYPPFFFPEDTTFTTSAIIQQLNRTEIELRGFGHRQWKRFLPLRFVLPTIPSVARSAYEKSLPPLANITVQFSLGRATPQSCLLNT